MRKPSIGILSTIFILLAFTAVSWKTNKINTQPETDTKVEVTAVNNNVSSADLFDQHITDVYNKINLSASELDFEVFKKAVVGYYNLKSNNLISKSNNVISIVDFNKPSTKKRLWIVDLDNNKLLFNTLVAHGQGSGDDLAQNFSNLENSHQSSLGFYVTSDIYSGKHGLSMKLDGMDAGFNTNAKDRSVVVHGAAYVSQDFIKTHGRLGRSYGCPALPVEMTKTIIDHIKGKTTLYINGPAKTYKSKFADLNQAVNSFITTANTVTAS